MQTGRVKGYKDYLAFKEEYLAQYNHESVMYFQDLETKEDWIVRIKVEKLIKTFNKLPSVCQKPFDEHDANLIEQLIKLLAYLPLIDSVTALAFLGLENEEYGYAIYEIAYQSSMVIPPCVMSRTIVDRVSIVNRVAMFQTIKGTKL
ncbi:hypothetical protein L1D14_20505 [Vibrio tubiashii]|uniref:hypothetical protein n=1 Tax=Vibrio tubiashii TaxID=29498 RepID=UPI001EFD261D|nr:hypothetical protein [Vibrio tubiashii]MCG9578603.1 hypothetical protein [Vibrio tubiashii]